MKKLLLLLILLSMGTFFKLVAQSEAGISVGLVGYQGDVLSRSDQNIGYLKELNPSFGLLYKYNFQTNWAIRVNLTYLRLSGSDADSSNPDRAARNFSFTNNILETSALLQYDIGQKKKFTPYLIGGIAVLFGSPDISFNGRSNPNINLDQEAGSTQLALPLGGGLRYNFSEALGIALEMSASLPFSDYYDGISYAANPNKNDIYGTGAVKLFFSLNGKDSDKDGITDKLDACPDKVGIAELMGCPDTDKDGIKDAEDDCPLVAGKAIHKGCPDSDNDGIIDSEDKCPDVAGLAAMQGCADSDGDGINDLEDPCPTEAGAIKDQGCPDSDQDGIVDKFDKCPNQAGEVSQKGCPKDQDNDGIIDAEDACPDIAGKLEYNGCIAPDTDQDGIRDDEDKCPESFGLAQFQGCPQAETASPNKELLVQASQNIQFKTNGNELTTASKTILDKVTESLRNSDVILTITGHTDNVGSIVSNQKLSERRAKAVFDYLKEKGIPTANMQYKGSGELTPIADNTTAAGRQKNRRVELKLGE